MKSHVLFALKAPGMLSHAPRMLSRAKRYRTFYLWRWYFLRSGQTAQDFSRTCRTVRHFLYSGQKSRTVRPNGAKRPELSDLSAKITYCLPSSRAGRPRQTAHPDFLKMLACNFLLKLSYKSCDFEPLQAQIGQVPICGLLGTSNSCTVWPEHKKACTV